MISMHEELLGDSSITESGITGVLRKLLASNLTENAFVTFFTYMVKFLKLDVKAIPKTFFDNNFNEIMPAMEASFKSSNSPSEWSNTFYSLLNLLPHSDFFT